jgi:HEAT repeat protein
MWPSRRKAAAAEALLKGLRAHAWKTEVERDELIKSVAALPDLEAEDVAWMGVEPDVALRQAGLAISKRFPYEASSAALFPFLASKTEAIRRQAMQSLEHLAGGNFLERLQGFLASSDPVVVHAALDHLRRNPNERALPWIARVLTSSTVAPVRKKAFGIIEATASPRVAGIALAALEDEDEEIRFRAIKVIASHPMETQIGPLLQHCRNDSNRVQDAAITALGPLLA